MLYRWLYQVTRPPPLPLRRVTLYYAALGMLSAVLMGALPGLADLATRGPEPAAGLGAGLDVFEPVGGPPAVMRAPLLEAGRLAVSLVAALALMVPASWIYMGTRTRTGFDQSVVQTLLILPLAVAGIVTIVHDSVALAFSLAGIVAGVRFRNSLRDTADALYIFAAIGVGLACGVGSLPVAAVVSLFFNYTILLLWRCDYGVCPQGGPQEEYSSGWMLGHAGVAPSDYPKLVAQEVKKGKKRRKKQRNRALPGFVPPGDPIPALAQAAAREPGAGAGRRADPTR